MEQSEKGSVPAMSGRPGRGKALPFAYVAVDKSRKRVSGTVSAADKRAAMIIVERLGLVPVSIVPAQTAGANASAPAAESEPAAGTAFRFQCPACLHKLEATPEMEGDRISCPKCGKRFAIPTPQQAMRTVSIVPLAAQGHTAGGDFARRGWKRRPVIIAATTTVLTVIGLSVFVLPRLLPGTVKRPPVGWVGHDDPQTGSTVYAPRDWKRWPDKKNYGSHGEVLDHLHFYDESSIMLARTDDSAPIQGPARVEIIFWKGPDEFQAKDAHRFLAEVMAESLAKGLEMPQVNFILQSHVIHKVAGCIAVDTVAQDGREKMRVVMLVAKNCAGAKQLVTLRCWADASRFDENDSQIFRPMIASFVYGRSRQEETN